MAHSNLLCCIGPLIFSGGTWPLLLGLGEYGSLQNDNISVYFLISQFCAFPWLVIQTTARKLLASVGALEQSRFLYINLLCIVGFYFSLGLQIERCVRIAGV